MQIYSALTRALQTILQLLSEIMSLLGFHATDLILLHMNCFVNHGIIFLVPYNRSLGLLHLVM